MEKKLLWVDCEMTGLDPVRDHLLEVAIIVTDFDLKEIIEGPRVIIHQPREILENMNEWCRETHTSSGLFQSSLESATTLAHAEDELITFVSKHVERGRAFFAGNTVYQDYAFLRVYMPMLVAWAHYRLVDVSSLKELVKGWYPEDPVSHFEKERPHRALEDLRESIAELQHYREHFFKKA